MADNYDAMNKRQDEIFSSEDSGNGTFNSWMLRSALKGISGLVLAIGFLPIVLWYIQTSTFMMTITNFLFIWTGILLWAIWYYLEIKYNKMNSQ